MKMHQFLSIVLLLLTFQAMAQEPATQGTVVKGTVVTEQREAVPGVTILEEGTSNGAATDANGHFSLRLLKLPATLSVRSVGFDSRTVTVSSATGNLQIVLTSSSKQLKDIVVIGYSEQKKANLIGAVSSIDTKDLSKMAVTGVAGDFFGNMLAEGKERNC